MSRLGKKPIPLPDGVEVRFEGNRCLIKGPRATLEEKMPSILEGKVEEGGVMIYRQRDSKRSRSLQGLYCRLIGNAIHGVSEGYHRDLIMTGVGYRAEMRGRDLVLSLGFSHPVTYSVPEGIVTSVKGKKISIEGADKQQVGEIAAQIRKLRPPEPYTGKGIRYEDEVIRRKVGKVSTALT